MKGLVEGIMEDCFQLAREVATEALADRLLEVADQREVEALMVVYYQLALEVVGEPMADLGSLAEDYQMEPTAAMEALADFHLLEVRSQRAVEEMMVRGLLAWMVALAPVADRVLGVEAHKVGKKDLWVVAKPQLE